MNLSFDKDKMTVKIEVADLRDLVLAEKIKNIVQSDEWKEMIVLYSIIREAMLESLKNILQSETHLRMAAYRSAVFKGFDECLSIPGKIIESETKYREERLKETEEALYAGNGDKE